MRDAPGGAGFRGRRCFFSNGDTPPIFSNSLTMASKSLKAKGKGKSKPREKEPDAEQSDSDDNVTTVEAIDLSYLRAYSMADDDYMQLQAVQEQA